MKTREGNLMWVIRLLLVAVIPVIVLIVSVHETTHEMHEARRINYSQ